MSIIRTSSLTDSLLSETIQFAGIQAFPRPAAPRRYRPPACASLIGTHPGFRLLSESSAIKYNRSIVQMILVYYGVLYSISTKSSNRYT